ncbi:DUF4832 domain-containing protein [Noviherbaspirillum sp. Root189]|uniref:DUF4832 domain-containing protein n=1 Tax=Noviherbaspirillum sp. Root189 TaxID=1736487 RepID=UPI00138F5351|nr:DUF4832 domain-containing protein [Noviherbaspirillum sp. Root189]
MVLQAGLYGCGGSGSSGNPDNLSSAGSPAQLATKIAPEVFQGIAYRPAEGRIANPERGMYRQVDCNARLDAPTLQALRLTQDVTLVLCLFKLKPFTTSPITPDALALFQHQMDAIRLAGLKAIVRFAYSDTESPEDAAPAQVMLHLDQLAFYLAANKDVIATVQAGFVGSWGEWDNSTHFGMSIRASAQNFFDRAALIDKLLSVLPVERMVQLRAPQIKRSYLSTSLPLTIAESYTGSPKARLGYHNDCFLASSSDLGTYDDINIDYPYLGAESLHVPVGGETCAYVQPRADCPTALAELTAFHWSYISLDYHPSVIDAWKKQGCWASIEQHLGYRFVLEDGSYAVTAEAGGNFALTLNLRNDGWAAPYNGRNVELVLRHTQSGALYRFRIPADPRMWLPGQRVSLAQSLTLPTNMEAGNYLLLLNLPDPEVELSDRPEYSVRFANDGVFEAATGFNSLQHEVAIGPAS